MNDKQRVVVFLSVVFIVLSVFLIIQFTNTAKNDPFYETNFIIINEHAISVELATTPEQRERGLMERQTLEDNTGMLFIFSEESKHSFWMKNMNVSLDIIWINSDGEVVYLVNDVPPCTKSPCQTYTPNIPALYVLEVNPGTIGGLEIQVGTEISIFLNNM